MHTFVIYISKHLNTSYKTDTTVSITWRLWGWMEGKGEEKGTSISSACYMPVTRFYWILSRAQKKEHIIIIVNFIWRNKCLEVKYLPQGIKLKWILLTPKPWFIFLCPGAFVLATPSTWIAFPKLFRWLPSHSFIQVFPDLLILE